MDGAAGEHLTGVVAVFKLLFLIAFWSWRIRECVAICVAFCVARLKKLGAAFGTVGRGAYI